MRKYYRSTHVLFHLIEAIDVDFPEMSRKIRGNGNFGVLTTSSRPAASYLLLAYIQALVENHLKGRKKNMRRYSLDFCVSII